MRRFPNSCVCCAHAGLIPILGSTNAQKKSRFRGSFLPLARDIRRYAANALAFAVGSQAAAALWASAAPLCVLRTRGGESNPRIPNAHKKEPLSRLFCVGGSEGNRTPVRKPIHKTFSVGSLRFKIPLGRRSQTIYARR